MLDPGPASAGAFKFLQEHVVILAAHGRLNNALQLSFEDIPQLEAKDQAGHALSPVARNDLPPVNLGMLSAVEGLFRQSFGVMGQGMKLFVFNSKGVGSCKQGQLSVLLADETYTWDTPFPKCQPNQ
jgi:hypothetical protein